MKIENGYHRIQQYKIFDECFNIKNLPIIYDTIELYALDKNGKVLHKIPNSGWFCMHDVIYPRLYAEKFMINYELCEYAKKITIHSDEVINSMVTDDKTEIL